MCVPWTGRLYQQHVVPGAVLCAFTSTQLEMGWGLQGDPGVEGLAEPSASSTNSSVTRAGTPRSEQLPAS